ncbi:hypothetical protein ZWY2020_023378 [Hordeum vulgare]|nr:hypothetical protein ZWY2020_023378 [Hordeum vulgare]
MEVGRKVVPVRLLEDVNRWDFVDLPIFRSQADADDTALAEIGRGSFEPTLLRLVLPDQIPPFPTRNAIRTIESELGSECLIYLLISVQRQLQQHHWGKYTKLI